MFCAHTLLISQCARACVREYVLFYPRYFFQRFWRVVFHWILSYSKSPKASTSLLNSLNDLILLWSDSMDSSKIQFLFRTFVDSFKTPTIIGEIQKFVYIFFFLYGSHFNYNHHYSIVVVQVFFFFHLYFL